MSQLVAVDSLSDEEPRGAMKSRSPNLQHRHRSNLRRPARGRIVETKSAGSSCGPNDNRKNMSNIIQGKCGCTADCFSYFRYHDDRVEKWRKERELLSKMEKLEKDDYVWVS